MTRKALVLTVIAALILWGSTVGILDTIYQWLRG